MRQIKSKKNILIITKSSWTDSSAFGNTLSNFFNNFNDDFVFSNIYCRSTTPDNTICSYYFNITAKQIIKNLFRPSKIGISLTKDITKKLQNTKEKKHLELERFNLFKTKFRLLYLFFVEILWMVGKWQNKRLDSFLEQNQIDIIFAAAADPIYLQTLVNYCRKKTNAKLVLFFTDDVYNYKNFSPFHAIYQFALRRSIKKSVENSSLLYGASKNLCEEYESYFERKIKPLYKGCIISKDFVKKTVSSPIKVVYAGNLYYERWKTLKVLADEIIKINGEAPKIVLEVYTTTLLTRDIYEALNRAGGSKIMGSLSYEKIKEVLASADIVLHVESFKPTQVKTTRLSFSTKIIDCLQSGSCLLAIGPSCIASIQYLLGVEGTVVVTDLRDIGKVISNLVEHPQQIINKANQLKRFAEKNHNYSVIQEQLRNDLMFI